MILRRHSSTRERKQPARASDRSASLFLFHDTPPTDIYTLSLHDALPIYIFLYQGEELGLPQAELALADLKDPEAIINWPLILGRDGARTPMPWVGEAPHAGFSSVRP